MSSTRRGRLELVAVDGNPTDAERAAILHALEHIVEAERQSTSSSHWSNVEVVIRAKYDPSPPRYQPDIVRPPLTLRTWPVTNDVSSLKK